MKLISAAASVGARRLIHLRVEAATAMTVLLTSLPSFCVRLRFALRTGQVGLLDIPTHKYATLLRSHTNTVHAVALDPHNARMCTAAADGSIRIWNTETFQQLLEFVVPGECCYCAMYHPYDPVVACGFGKGLVRIFSVRSPSRSSAAWFGVAV